jgi:divalent metal cation (Fe/Co/Zn/Cd) transporter
MAEEQHNVIPVWFFVGIIMFIYGILIFVTGITEIQNPPPTVLAHLHAPIWWGALLTFFGGFFISLFRPKKR